MLRTPNNTQLPSSKPLKILFLLICYFLFNNLVCASILNTDSILKVTKRQRDSALVESYFSLFRYYFKQNHQPDSMLKYAALSYKAAAKYDLPERMIKSKRAIGLAYIESKQSALAIKELNTGLHLAEQHKNAKEIIEINNLLGYLFGKENKLEKSAYYYLNTAKQYELLNDNANLAFNYVNIVVLFTLLEQPEKILYYTRKSISILPKLNPKKDAETMVSVYSSAAQHYLFIGELLDKKKVYGDSAKIYADSCLAIGLRYKLTDGLADAYYVLGNWFESKANFNKAVWYFKKCLDYKASIPQKSVLNCYSSLSKLYFEKGNAKLAAVYLDTCNQLPISKELDNPYKLAELEYNIYKKMGNPVRALKSLEDLIKEKKLIQNAERNKVINELESKYQSELKESEIVKLSQQKEIYRLRIRSLFAVVLAITLLLFFILFFYRQSIIKNKLKTIEIEQRLNRARMNPHFFFNALGAVQNLALQSEKQHLVPLYIAKFSRIMRQSLESTFNELDTLENEIAFLTDYLEIHKLLLSNRFNYTFELDERLAAEEVLIPGMLLQPFVENAIVHGFKNIDYAGEIKIAFTCTDNLLRISIQDNGVGIKDKQEPKKYPSRASQIIYDRLYLLHKTYKVAANFMELISEPGQGVKIEINLPLVYTK